MIDEKFTVDVIVLVQNDAGRDAIEGFGVGLKLFVDVRRRYLRLAIDIFACFGNA